MADSDDDFVFDEFEEKFNAMDSELEEIRSSLVENENNKDNTTSTLISSKQNAALAENAAAEMEQIIKTLNEQQGTKEDPLEATDTSPQGKEERQHPVVVDSNTASTKKSSPVASLVFLAVPILLAFIVGQKLSTKNPTSLDNDAPGHQVSQNERNNNYQEKRKIERCKYVNGEKYCESEEQSTSSGNGGDGPQRVYAFQKCRYVNGESYCESVEQRVSTDNFLSRGQLAAEFKDADQNRDGQVSKPEFERYKRLYLQQNPEMTNSFAAFEDFDLDSNGFITVEEHEGYYKALGLL